MKAIFHGRNICLDDENRDGVVEWLRLKRVLDNENFFSPAKDNDTRHVIKSDLAILPAFFAAVEERRQAQIVRTLIEAAFIFITSYYLSGVVVRNIAVQCHPARASGKAIAGS
jgi:hypothetical protein